MNVNNLNYLGNTINLTSPFSATRVQAHSERIEPAFTLSGDDFFFSTTEKTDSMNFNIMSSPISEAPTPDFFQETYTLQPLAPSFVENLPDYSVLDEKTTTHAPTPSLNTNQTQGKSNQDDYFNDYFNDYFVDDCDDYFATTSTKETDMRHSTITSSTSSTTDGDSQTITDTFKARVPSNRIITIWNPEEENKLKDLAPAILDTQGRIDWKTISELIPSRTPNQLKKKWSQIKLKSTPTQKRSLSEVISDEPQLSKKQKSAPAKIYSENIEPEPPFSRDDFFFSTTDSTDNMNINSMSYRISEAPTPDFFQEQYTLPPSTPSFSGNMFDYSVLDENTKTPHASTLFLNTDQTQGMSIQDVYSETKQPTPSSVSSSNFTAVPLGVFSDISSKVYSSGVYWTPEEENKLKELTLPYVKDRARISWKTISKLMPSRTPQQLKSKWRLINDKFNQTQVHSDTKQPAPSSLSSVNFTAVPLDVFKATIPNNSSTTQLPSTNPRSTQTQVYDDLKVAMETATTTSKASNTYEEGQTVTETSKTNRNAYRINNRWTLLEVNRLKELALTYIKNKTKIDWKKISKSIMTKTIEQCRSKWKFMNHWTPDDKIALTELKDKNLSWSQIANHFSDKTWLMCKHYWEKYIEPSQLGANLNWTEEEDCKLKELTLPYFKSKEEYDWQKISDQIKTKTPYQCGKRWSRIRRLRTHNNSSFLSEPVETKDSSSVSEVTASGDWKLRLIDTINNLLNTCLIIDWKELGLKLGKSVYVCKYHWSKLEMALEQKCSSLPAWSKYEENLLVFSFIKYKSWIETAKQMTGKTPTQCRLYYNYRLQKNNNNSSNNTIEISDEPWAPLLDEIIEGKSLEWTKSEDDILLESVQVMHDNSEVIDWIKISGRIQTKSRKQCSKRWREIKKKNIAGIM